MPSIEYSILIHKYLSNEISPGERRVLDDWLAQDPAHRDEFEEIKLLWDSAESAEDDLSDQQLFYATERFESMVNAQKPATHSRGSNKRLVAILIFVFFIMGIFSALAYLFIPEYEPLTIHPKGIVDLVLSDNSTVTLNRESSFVYTGKSDHSAVLSGQAIFRMEDRDEPFNLKIGTASILVTGTSYAVKAYPDSTVEIVALESPIEVLANEQNIILGAGEKGELSGDSLRRLKVNDDMNFNSWYTSRIEFKKTSLADVLKTLERHFDVHFKIEGDHLSTCRFTGIFDNVSLTSIQQTLSYSMNIQFKQTAIDHFSVEGTGCKQ